MSSTYSIVEARGKLGDLARRAAQHEHITLTDRGVPAAVLISPVELENLQSSLALAEYENEKLNGTLRTVSHEEARRRLGFTK
ncbi:type II toxin-antitoxin system prevent-host-death family antitoxin [Streptomyces sp. NPDC091272]|uniref:type II toxin-antitoxin system prevent-host-death family antitoxin n=1 Tax=Streptomyces sp. NPDC091272 TaxID=3365981 RepID=UPI0037F37EBB